MPGLHAQRVSRQDGLALLKRVAAEHINALLSQRWRIVYRGLVLTLLALLGLLARLLCRCLQS